MVPRNNPRSTKATMEDASCINAPRSNETVGELKRREALGALCSNNDKEGGKGDKNPKPSIYEETQNG
jgi:hypothetical protein